MTEILDLKNTARGLGIKILNRVDRTDAYLEKLLDIELKHSDLNSRDKALLYELVHGVIRWQGKLDWILTGFYHGDFSKSTSVLKNTLRLALYQILFLSSIPHHAAVNEAVEYVKEVQGEKYANQVNAVLRNIIRSIDSIRYPNPEEDMILYLSVIYSHPYWMVKRWINRYGSEFTQKLLEENNERPKISLRYNSMLIKKDEFIGKLNEAELKFIESKYIPEFFTLQNLSNITEWNVFKQGLFSIQDESAGIPCIVLNPQEGDEILDLCSAPGGKTTFISEMMNNTGKIYALDKYSARLNILRKNVERLKISNIEFLEMDALNFSFHEVDRILIDAPCSGLGVLKKKPDIKWKRDLEDIKNLNITQLGLLENAKDKIKINGTIVYSTCSIEPEENWMVVNKFLENNSNFELDKDYPLRLKDLVDENGCISTFPHIHKIDGSFTAKIKRVK